MNHFHPILDVMIYLLWMWMLSHLDLNVCELITPQKKQAVEFGALGDNERANIE